jgi:alanyl-tRNA synthetase
MKGSETRDSFIKYFAERGHTRVPSSSLIPDKDPTILFANAGMNQFKRVFLGGEKRDYKRACSSQKCVRAGGKHNDLENVGRTSRHHTFFEMLGNFSFGDYFKEQAIEFAWEYLTKIAGLDKSKLYATVFREDDEALELWKKVAGLPADRIVKMGEADNFWSMGEEGPCGPCSEILIDQGEGTGCGKPGCKVGCECDRYLELWNLVFMQYDRKAGGKMEPLPKPSIDTGMGLERICAVLQGAKSNFETDLIRPIIADLEKLAKRAYGRDGKDDVSFRVIADHERAMCFLIADGVLPSNEGRGYVLRRIMRRAIRHGRNMGFSEPFMFRLAERVIADYSPVFPELKDRHDLVTLAIKSEEERFLETLEKGKTLGGEAAFKLYDTFGFPLDLTQDILRERGMTVDTAGFEALMESQRERSKEAWSATSKEETQKLKAAFQDLGPEIPATKFLGYERLTCGAKVLGIYMKGGKVDSAAQGDKASIVLDESVLYAESGGQSADSGLIRKDGGLFEVTDVSKTDKAVFIHSGVVKQGAFKTGEAVTAEVDEWTRRRTAANHSATHILHWAMRKTLGEHVRQAGSLVEPERLRFDFTHFTQVTEEQLRAIEDMANEKVLLDEPVATNELAHKEAIARGALAFFGEKYGERVRLVEVGSFSKELCGGTHVGRTGEIGMIKIVSEGSVASGVRRMEAVTGLGALEYVKKQDETLRELAVLMKAGVPDLAKRARKMQEQIKELEKKLSEKGRAAAGPGAEDIGKSVKEIKGIRLLAMKADLEDPKALRDLGDSLKQKLGSGILVLGNASGGKATLLVMVTNDLVEKYNAGKIIKELAPIVGGRGGGKPDMAQAGGDKPEMLDAALAKASELI